MGTLRIMPATSSSDELVGHDPYDFLSFDEPSKVSSPARRDLIWLAGLGMLASLVLAGLGAFYLAASETNNSALPFAYFEIKVLDGDGRPVPGATVHDGEQPIGVTDSFGEWRRFLKVRLGTTMPLRIAKKRGKGVTLTAIKNMAVPPVLPPNGELELTGSVQLVQFRDQSGNITAPTVGSEIPAGDAMSAGRGGAAGSALAEANRQAKTVQLGDAGPQVLDPSVTAAAATVRNEIAFDSLKLVVEPSTDPRLAEVAAQLQQRAQQLDLKLSSSAAWQLSLRHIATPSEDGKAGGLILVESHYLSAGNSEPLFSYLRNYQSDMLQTARDLLWAMTLHARKTHRIVFDGQHWVLQTPEAKLWRLAPGRVVEALDGSLYRLMADPRGSERLVLAQAAASPCDQAKECNVIIAGLDRSPPHWGWRRQKLQLLGPSAGPTEVYVAGFAARSLSGGLYEFWAPVQAITNLTVLANGKLMVRERLGLGARGLLRVSLPQPPISMR